MMELAIFTIALSLPYSPQLQLILTMSAEGSVLVILLVCLPNLSIFRNVIHIAARSVDLVMLAYLFAYDPCTEMEYVSLPFVIFIHTAYTDS